MNTKFLNAAPWYTNYVKLFNKYKNTLVIDLVRKDLAKVKDVEISHNGGERVAVFELRYKKQIDGKDVHFKIDFHPLPSQGSMIGNYVYSESAKWLIVNYAKKYKLPMPPSGLYKVPSEIEWSN